MSDAFLSGLGLACLVTAGVAIVGSVLAARFLPARAAQDAPSTDLPAPEATAVD